MNNRLSQGPETASPAADKSSSRILARHFNALAHVFSNPELVHFILLDESCNDPDLAARVLDLMGDDFGPLGFVSRPDSDAPGKYIAIYLPAGNSAQDYEAFESARTELLQLIYWADYQRARGVSSEGQSWKDALAQAQQHFSQNLYITSHSAIELSGFAARDISSLLLRHISGAVSVSINNTIATLSDPFSGLHTSWSHSGSTVDFLGWRYGESGQKEGRARQLMANRVAFYTLLGKKTMYSDFEEVGAYAFARYGFLPRSPADWELLRGKLEERLAQLRPLLPESAVNAISSLLSHDNPESLWRIADMQDVINGQKLGYRLLKGLWWKGRFDLDNPRQIARMRAYIGPGRFDDAMNHARSIKDGRPAVAESARPLPGPVIS